MLEDGAVDPWTKPQYELGIQGFIKEIKVGLTVPFCDLRTESAKPLSGKLRVFEEVENKKAAQGACASVSKPHRGYAQCRSAADLDCGAKHFT